MTGPRTVLLLAASLLGACTTTTTERHPRPDFAVEATVDADSVAAPISSPLGTRSVEPFAQDPGEAQGEGSRAAELRARFGSNILLKPDGRVTKQYYLAKEAGSVLRSLLVEPGGDLAPAHQTITVSGETPSMVGRMLGDASVEILYVEDFETIEGVVMDRPIVNTAQRPTKTHSQDLVLVTGHPDALAAFEGAFDLFFANIPQVEIEVQVVEYTTTDGLAIGIDQIDAGANPPVTPTLDQLSSNKLVENIISRFPLNPSLAGQSATDRGTFLLGGIHDSWQLAAQLQALETRGVADVLSRPKLVVRNGGVASVVTRTDLPFPQAQISSSGQNITANIVFKPVGITLTIRPVIAGTETVILQVYANISAVTSFADTEPVDTPVISKREVLTSVHVSNGKTTVIGGLVSRSTLSTETKFPILGDIPILGYLFRSTSESTQRTDLHFHITPRIIQGPRGFQAGSDG